MKVLLANPHGFCAGVVTAVESLQRVLDAVGPPVYVYHEIVHNARVVETFQRQGAHFVDAVEQVPPGAILLFSAHGVSPEVRQQAAERQIRVIDATCPLVAKVHLEAIRFAKQGYAIVFIGHRDHDEAVGTMGEAPDAMWLVETVDDVDELPFERDALVAYLMQTTLSVDDAMRIVDRLEQRFPNLAGPASDDICYATQNRQTALKRLLPDVDLALVVGSSNSSNSNRLREIAAQAGKRAYLIDEAADIDPQWLTQVDSLLLTAGASAPEESVLACLDYLIEKFDAELTAQSTVSEPIRFPMPAGMNDFCGSPQ